MDWGDCTCNHLMVGYCEEYDCDCPVHSHVKKKKDVMVAPGIYQSQEDYEANHAFDEARDNEL